MEKQKNKETYGKYLIFPIMAVFLAVGAYASVSPAPKADDIDTIKAQTEIFNSANEQKLYAIEELNALKKEEMILAHNYEKAKLKFSTVLTKKPPKLI